MKRMKKVCAIMLGIVMLVGVTAFAAVSNSASQDGIQAIIQTDKNSYAANEEIQVNITVTNTNHHAVKNVSIEALLPDELTLKDGALQSDTVNLDAGETLTLSCTAMLEKEIVTEPGTTEEPTETEPIVTEPSTTEEPVVTEPDTTLPEGTTSEPTTEEPATVDPTTSEPATNEPTTIPGTTIPATEGPETTESTTDGGILLPVEPTTDRNSPSTTQPDSSTENSAVNPDTGDSSHTMTKVLACLAAAGAVVVAIVVMQKKNSKKATRVISLVLCGAIAISGIAATGFLSVSAEDDNSRSFTVQTVVTVDGGDYTLSANVIYDKPQVEETDTWYQDVDEEHVVVDEDGFKYIDNHIIIMFDIEATENDKKNAVDAVNGKIVGDDSGTQYQVELPEIKNISELRAVCDKIETMKGVLHCYYETVFLPSEMLSAVPNDPWKDTFEGIFGTDWDESNPDGLNWWLETIEAPSAWDYNERFNNIKVGIVDGGFETNHEDLNLTIINPNENMTTSHTKNHGTHVAGIIGATANNDVGITGIVWDKELYCADVPLSGDNDPQIYTSILSVYDGITQLLEKGCKIINKSIGCLFRDLVPIIEDGKTAISYIIKWKEELKRDDFIIMQSAGNDGVDSVSNGSFSSITDASIHEFFSEHENYKEKYSYSDIYQHFMVVGAIEQNENGYKLCDKEVTVISDDFAFDSNYGDYVSVVAPGYKIYSCSEMGGLDGNYRYMSGTSMSTPIVTGVAALVWSVNPDFSAATVKDIVCTSTNKTAVSSNKNDTRTSYPIVNARLAVEKAIRISDNQFYGVTGAVLAEDTKEPIANATVSVYDGNTLLGQTQTSESGTYKLTFNSDTTSQYFKLTVDKAGRWPYINSQLELTAGVTTVVENIYMKLWDSGLEPGENPDPENPFAGGDGSVENPYQISTPEQLDAVRDYMDSNFVLINSIDMAKFVDENGKLKNFNPLGYDKDKVEPFTGIFDGKNYSITNLKIHDKNYNVGLFNELDDGAIVKNLKVTNAVIEAGEGSGTIVGANAGVVQNCTVSSKMSNISYSASNGLGGIVGFNYDGATVENCEFRGYINTMNVNNGGIASSNRGDIIRCCYRGNYCYGGYLTGGIVGSNAGRIIDCYNSSFVSSNYNNGNMGYDRWNLQGIAGGIAGQNSGLIRGCFNNGYVYGWCYDSYYTGRLGGITAQNSGKIEYCYNTGTLEQVRGNAYMGGIAALDQGGTIDHCYNIGDGWNGDSLSYGGVRGNKENNHVFVGDFVLTGDQENDACEFVSADTMKTTGFIARLNADQVYFVQDTKNINGGYPILKWQQE